MKAKCRKCGDTIEVTRPREFKSCKCGAIALDYGDGEYYFRVCGNPEDFDGDIEGAPKKLDRATDIIGEENIGGESKPMKKAIKVEDVIACAIELASLGHPLMLDEESLQKLN